MSADWPIKIRFDPHGRMLAQPAVMSKRFVYVLRNNESPPRYYQASPLTWRDAMSSTTPATVPHCQVPSVVD